MIDWNSVVNLIAVNGVAYPLIREIWAYIRHRKSVKDSLEASVRKDLWNEISNLRVAISGATQTLVDWQARYLELLSQHKTTIEELAEARRSFMKLRVLLGNALDSLFRIEEVERHISEPNLDKAKEDIQTMREEAETIREKASILYQV